MYIVYYIKIQKYSFMYKRISVYLLLLRNYNIIIQIIQHGIAMYLPENDNRQNLIVEVIKL